MLELNKLVEGKEYIHNGETRFTYIGQGDSELSRHNVSKSSFTIMNILFTFN
jgi:hypothetical protein